MRYRLRTLLILLAIGPPMLAVAWWASYPPPRNEWHGDKGQARTQAGMLSDVVKMYYLDVGTLPPDLNALLRPPLELPNPQKWSGPYLVKTQLPVDPWNNQFQYKILNSSEADFRVWSNGPDGASQTSDDISAPR